MQSSRKKATVHRLRAEPTFTAGETVVLYEPDAPFGELCFVTVREAPRARVQVNYYGTVLALRPEGREWSSKCGRWRVEKRNPERIAASIALRAGRSGGDAANEKE